jgi:hypothetical protein
MKKLLILAIFGGIAYGGYTMMNVLFEGGKGAMNPAVQLTKGQEAVNAARRAMGKDVVDSVQRAVNAFHDTEGRFPTSLQELVDKKYIETVPGGVTYDPATGTVSAG